MEHLAVAIHVFVCVLIAGTLWRLLAYHLISSDNEALDHIGRAMTFQY